MTQKEIKDFLIQESEKAKEKFKEAYHRVGIMLTSGKSLNSCFLDLNQMNSMYYSWQQLENTMLNIRQKEIEMKDQGDKESNEK